MHQGPTANGPSTKHQVRKDTMAPSEKSAKSKLLDSPQRDVVPPPSLKPSHISSWVSQIFLAILLTAFIATIGLAWSGHKTTQADTYKLCDAQCIASFETAFAGETKLWVSPDFDSDRFYDTPANATGAKPGDLLRWQDVTTAFVGTNFSGIPGGMSISRFIYMSEDMERNPVPASAFVLLPYALATADEPDRTKFRTLAWAHGTTGNARKCAPSNNQNLAYGWEGPVFFASHGYAVIATDYAGMGTKIPGGFQYEAGYLHAADVAYSVVAARRMIGHLLSPEWAVIGHSEGGMTAWRTNERLAMAGQEELLKAGTFLGAVAAAPALRPYDLIPKSFEIAGDGPLGAVVSVYLLQSVQGLFPELQIKDWLTPEAQELVPLLEKSCLTSGQALFAPLTIKQIFTSTSWVSSPAMKDWQDRVNGAGPEGKPHALAKPMLVVQGVNDTLTYAAECVADFDKTCAAHPESSAELVLVPGLDHDQSFYAAQPYYWSWVQRLFAGEIEQTGCSKTTLQPVTNHYQKAYYGY